jgi:transposase
VAKRFSEAEKGAQEEGYPKVFIRMLDDRLAVVAMKVVHPGLSCEAVVAKPVNPTALDTRMNVHKNARLTWQGRLLMVRRIEEEGWTVVVAAAAAGLSVRRAHEWLRRYRAGGELLLHDRSSAPGRCRTPVPAERVAEVERLRRNRLTGPHRHLGQRRRYPAHRHREEQSIQVAGARYR